ncbi:unnamed protein product [Cunninghamella echinulata]
MRTHEDQYLPNTSNTNDNKSIRNITPQSSELEMDMDYDMNAQSNDIEMDILYKSYYQSYYRDCKGNYESRSTLSPYIKKAANYAFKYNISHDQYKNLVPLLKTNEGVPNTLNKLKKVVKNDSYELNLPFNSHSIDVNDIPNFPVSNEEFYEAVESDEITLVHRNIKDLCENLFGSKPLWPFMKMGPEVATLNNEKM